jgi:threonine dehydrogenase-like Zn-dependent dehydrogenase
MWRVAKPEGVGNVVVERVPVPLPGPGEVLVRTQASLISRGSELWRRYEMEHAVSPEAMGYSTTGVVERLGADVDGYRPGDRVVAVAPHAEYSVRSVRDARHPRVYALDPRLSFEEGTFHPLATSAACWAQAAQVTPRDRVVVLGQGIVGNLVAQFVRAYRPAQLIGVDALDLRCRLAGEVGTPVVVDAGAEDPVAAVGRITGGVGASVVIDCVGGRAGIDSFVQAQKMLAEGGLIQVVGKYQNAPLPLDVDNFQGKRVLASYPPDTDRGEMGRVAMAALASGAVQVRPLITHRFSGREAKQAFDLLYRHPDQALGVLFAWA